MSEPASGTKAPSTIDSAIAEIVSAAADRAAERVLYQAAITRAEVEQELVRFNAERTSMIKEISLQVAAAAAKADLALVQHQLEEMTRFQSIEEKMALVATQMTNMAASFSQIAADVKSLLATRSYTQGAWKMLTVLAVVISAAVSMISNFLQNRWPWGH